MRNFAGRSRQDDEGFGLVEIMVSMVLLGILLMALIPILINSFRVTSKNTTIATATQLVSARLEDARTASVAGSCANVKAIIETPKVVSDGRGVPLTVTGKVTNCSQTAGNEHDEPRLATVVVTATTTSPNFTNPVATATTQIWVKFIS